MGRKIAIMIGIISVILSCFVPINSYADSTNQITKNGITWTFDKEYEYGTFANGDYWVKGLVIVTSITPGPADGRNGSMVNPVPNYNAFGATQAYDNRLNHYSYDAGFYPSGSSILNPGDSLVSTTSWDPAEPGAPITPSGYLRLVLKEAAVLTVVSETPAQGSLRPPYSGTAKPIYSANNLRKDLLPNLPLVPSTAGVIWTSNQVKELWLDHFNYEGDQTQYTSPSKNMPNYGREYMILMGNATLLLMLDQQELFYCIFLLHFHDLFVIIHRRGRKG